MNSRHNLAVFTANDQFAAFVLVHLQWQLLARMGRAVRLRTLHFFRSPPVVYRSNIRLLVVLGVIPDALKTAGCAQSRAVNDFVHTSTFLVNFGSVSSLFEVFQTCENLY